MSRRPECDFRDDVCQPFYLEGTPREGSTHGVLLLHGFTGTVAHRIFLTPAAIGRGLTCEDVLEQIIAGVKAPKLV